MTDGRTVGLVLGAGGAVGWAYHLGVVEGLRAVTGLTPPETAATIGTSAGGAIAASVYTGADSAEILDAVHRPLAPEDQQRMARLRAGRRRRPPFIGRPQAPGLVRRGGGIGLVGLLPAGIFPTFPLRRFPTPPQPPWPDGLWLPSVRLDDGAVVVFGRDRTDVDVADAVEATSAVPVLFAPKAIGDERFVDGAVASATNAELLVPLALALVLIASPMTRPGGGPVKRRARRHLQRERTRLEDAGTRTVVVEPDADFMAQAEGFPRERPEVGPQLVATARKQTIEALTGPGGH
ncbi:MAG: patatin-like phospholipase family protein [Actinomycetota bacterium]